jgi:hypothetical protein
MVHKERTGLVSTPPVRTFTATVVQKIGSTRVVMPLQARLLEAAEEAYGHMQRLGFRLTAEALASGDVAVAVEHPHRGEFARRTVPYGALVTAALTDLVLEFEDCIPPTAVHSPSRRAVLAQSE